VMVYGIDFKSFKCASKGFLFRDGRPFEGPDDAIADDIMRKLVIEGGERDHVLNHTFQSVGS